LRLARPLLLEVIHFNLYLDRPPSVNRPSLKPFSNIPSTPSTAVLPSFFKFRVYDLQICLWLTAAALYRELHKFDDARVAIAEADRVLEALIKTEDAIGTAKSRIFLKNQDFSTAAILKSTGPQNVKRDSRKIDGGESVGRWGLISLALRRQMADIAFEVWILHSLIARDACFERRNSTSKS
jgi:hypothetical protein